MFLLLRIYRLTSEMGENGNCGRNEKLSTLNTTLSSFTVYLYAWSFQKITRFKWNNYVMLQANAAMHRLPKGIPQEPTGILRKYDSRPNQRGFSVNESWQQQF